MELLLLTLKMVRGQKWQAELDADIVLQAADEEWNKRATQGVLPLAAPDGALAAALGSGSCRPHKFPSHPSSTRSCSSCRSSSV